MQQHRPSTETAEMFSRFIAESRHAVGTWRLQHTSIFICQVLDHLQKPYAHFRRHFAVGSLEPVPIDKIRNIAVVAHVDHGKTTLVDSLLTHCGCLVNSARLLDQGDLEKEKGITILAKSTRLDYNRHTLNVIDTPGHADFGGEVERVMSMVDGVILVVDLIDGPRPQSRFVLSKALANADIIPIVVVNKVDRPNERREGEIENEIFELFMNLGASDKQMEYIMLYGSARNGWMERTWKDVSRGDHSQGVAPLLDAVVSHVSCPVKKLQKLREKGFLPLEDSSSEKLSIRKTITEDFSMLINLVEKSSQWNLTITGAVASGKATRDSPVFLRSSETNELTKTRIKEVLVTKGVDKVPFPIASPGDIITLQLPHTCTPSVYDTISATSTAPALPFIPIDPPVLGVDVCPNTSPFKGEDGKLGSLHDLKTRLGKEALVNLAIQVKDNSTGTGLTVHGRGNLQLGILLETMRREGFEFEVTPPQVIFTRNLEGKRLEPWEQYTFIGPLSYSSEIVEQMAERNGDLIKQEVIGDLVVLVYNCATRLFFGMTNWLNERCKGSVTFTSEIIAPRLFVSSGKRQRSNAVVATAEGIVVAAELQKFQSSCRFFVVPNDRVYEGVIIGFTTRPEELLCNITKPKKMTVVRVPQKEIKEAVAPPIKTSIEYCISFINEDEIVEITPTRLCMRKKYLNSTERAKVQKQDAKINM